MTNDGDINFNNLGNGRRIDVDVDDSSLRAKLGRIVRHPIVETSPYRKDQVGMVHCTIGFISTVHT